MKIALFTDTCPDHIDGGAGTPGTLVAHVAERGHEVALVTPRVSVDASPLQRACDSERARAWRTTVAQPLALNALRRR